MGKLVTEERQGVRKYVSVLSMHHLNSTAQASLEIRGQGALFLLESCCYGHLTENHRFKKVQILIAVLK